MEKKVRIDQIVIGERSRRDLGDLDELVASIKEIGLLHPPIVTRAMHLVAGRRRLEALKRMGDANAIVRVAESDLDALRMLRAERDENTCRKPFTPTEAVEMGRRIEAEYKPKSQAKQAQGRQAGGKSAGKQTKAEAFRKLEFRREVGCVVIYLTQDAEGEYYADFGVSWARKLRIAKRDSVLVPATAEKYPGATTAAEDARVRAADYLIKLRDTYQDLDGWDLVDQLVSAVNCNDACETVDTWAEKVYAETNPKDGEISLRANCPQAKTQQTAKRAEPKRASDVAAEAAGVSRKTYEAAKKVVEAAEEDPDQFAAVAAEMDRTGNVSAAAKKVKAAKSPKVPKLEDRFTDDSDGRPAAEEASEVLRGMLGRLQSAWKASCGRAATGQLGAAVLETVAGEWMRENWWK